MIGEQYALGDQCLDRTEECTQTLRIFDIRSARSGLAVDLRQNGATQTVAAAREIDQQQARFARIEPQFRCQRIAHVLDARECRHDQRQRCRDFLAFRAVLPGRAHRQAVLADRYAHAECRAEVHAYGLDGVEQGGVLAGLACSGHPVGGELHPLDGADARGGDVGQRFAHGHPARCRTVDHRDRRALAHGHRFTQIGVEAETGHRDIRHGYLPRPDHLIARGEAAHGAITDGDEELLAGDCRKT